MNKKKLPKAIRPGAARTRSAASEAAVSVDPGSDAKGATMTADDTMATDTLAADRREMATKTVERFAVYAGAAGIIPIPLVDVATVGGVQIQMLRRLSQIYEVPFSENLGKSLLISTAGTAIPATSAVGTVSLLKAVPLLGMVAGAVAMPALSAGATYAIGMAFLEHFASGGTLLDFHAPDYREFIKKKRNAWRERRKGVGEPAAAENHSE